VNRKERANKGRVKVGIKGYGNEYSEQASENR
jgi:hypothetical protein